MQIDIGLLNDHEAIIRRVRGNIDVVGDKFHDVGTQDPLTGVLEKHEKSAWMLRSYLG
jgi:starvation-inducible DNA-binding protein